MLYVRVFVIVTGQISKNIFCIANLLSKKTIFFLSKNENEVFLKIDIGAKTK